MTSLRAPGVALIGLLLVLGAAAPVSDPHELVLRDALRAAIATTDSMTTRISMVTRMDGSLFYLKRAAGAPSARLVMRDTAGRETMLIDQAGIDGFAASPDASLVVVSIAGPAGGVLRVIETATGAARPDRIEGARFAALSWAPDGRSFFYTLASKAGASSPAHWRSARHVLGADPRRDRVLLDSAHLPFAFEGRPAMVAVAATPGSDFLVAWVSDALTGRSAFHAAPFASLATTKATPGAIPWSLVAVQADGVVAIAVRGARIDMLTRRVSPQGSIVEAALNDTNAFAHGRTVVAPGSGTLTGLGLARDALYFARRDGAAMSLLRLASGAPRPQIVTLPFSGTIAPPGSDAGGLVTDPRQAGADIGLQSWVQPLVWLHYDPRTHSVADLGLVPPFARGLRPYQAIETTARADDGTLIALSIVSRRDTPFDGRRPLLLDGAEAYDPTFMPTLLPWLDAGGVFAVAHLRGGAPSRDFIACAESLIARHLTDPAHLSAGGNDLISAAIIRRPDLFRPALLRPGLVGAMRAPHANDIADQQAFLLWRMGAWRMASGPQPP
ncbi:hypothetical protein [Lichenicoccus sp.]|uniref:hypothetical protein n=1 Tax=Lichenicoccus sp. TaxID=2781899 RepID=UPI003D13D221